MKRKQHKRFGFYLFTFVFLTAALFCEGCGVVGLVGTPTRHERKIKAEYDLTKHREQKILVLVYQPVWLNAQVNFRYHLTAKINDSLTQKLDIPAKYLIRYEEVSAFRAGRADFASLSPIEVGAALNAETVLFVMVDDCELNRMGEADYYKGFLSVRSSLHDVASGKRLWPTSAKGKSVKVGFEVEPRGLEAAVNRLARALAHCTVRYFYDCPEDKFKIGDERSGIGWESWKTERTLGDL